MNSPDLLTVYWLCSECGARGEVHVHCPNPADLEQQLTAIRAAYIQIGHEHAHKVAIDDPLEPRQTDAGEWIN